jgi:hypothetical protein
MLDKAIKSGREKRKAYKGSKSVDATCRNGGSCPYCKGSRKHKVDRQRPIESMWIEE